MVSSCLKGLKDMYSIQVKFIHCDNAGENKTLEEKYPSTECICGENLSIFNGKRQSNDELQRVHNKEKKTVMV